MSDDGVRSLARRLEECPSDEDALRRFVAAARRDGQVDVLCATLLRCGLIGRMREEAQAVGWRELVLPFREGDVVEMTEREAPWVEGPWRGVVLRLTMCSFTGEKAEHENCKRVPKCDGHDGYIRPLGNPTYRIVPSPEYLAKGLYVTETDLLEGARLIKAAPT